MVIQEDLTPFEASKDTADDLKKQHGDKATITHVQNTEEYLVRLKTGATIRVPKAVKYELFVAAQVPRGWMLGNMGFPRT